VPVTCQAVRPITAAAAHGDHDGQHQDQSDTPVGQPPLPRVAVAATRHERTSARRPLPISGAGSVCTGRADGPRNDTG
jgi:hypothetical protein